MRVNIVVRPPDLNWIAGRFATELMTRLPQHGIEVTVNSSKADLEYQQIVYGPPTTRPAVGLFTHGEARPRMFAERYDGQISMNSAMHQYLTETVGKSSPVVIEQPVSDQFRLKHPIVFGVCGRTYSDGRKGEHLVAKMQQAGYALLAWGSGWPCPIFSDKLSDLPGFYGALNYYVDTSSDEGGCTPALEAMAMGVPVISHTLGVDRPVLSYKTHDWDSLNKVLHQLTHPRTYDDWARDHAAYFTKVLAR